MPTSPSCPIFSTNDALFARTKTLVAAERRIGVEILECLREIDRRKAYAELKYDGLYTYCVKELGFTDAQAYQRIQAMRALKELPELKPKIESGALSVSNISKVQTHFRKRARVADETPPRTEKLDLFLAMENRTSREVDTKLAELRGERVMTKLVLDMDEELVDLWKRVKDLAAHRSGGDEANTFKLLAREWLRKNDPSEKAATRASLRESRVVEAPSLSSSRSSSPSPSSSSEFRTFRRAAPLVNGTKSKSQTSPRMASSRYIPSPLRRKIWLRDGGKCKRCGSRHALELDHLRPFALGGKTEEENLRLVCRSCNQFLAVKSFGVWHAARKREERFSGK